MIHFAYPNASPTQNLFLGCGRFVASPLDEPLGNGYEPVQPTIFGIAQVSEAALVLAPESSDTWQLIYEIKDESPQNFIGDSQGLAYLLALISRSQQISMQISTDIWCTGCIGIGEGMTPLLTTVDPTGFNIKLKAFLSEENQDKLFIVPAANVQPTDLILFRENNVEALSLNQFQNLNVQQLLKKKVILKVHFSELELLADTIFDKPAKSREPKQKKKIMDVIRFGGKEIEISEGDITQVEADAIASSDDSYLGMRGGVPGAILKAGGDIIWEETRKYVPAELGSAVVTSAGRLHAEYVIHSVIGDFDKGIMPDAHLVEKAVINCLNEAERLGCRTIAMPVLNVEYVIHAMTDTISRQLKSKANLQKVFIVLYEQDILFDYLKASMEK